MPKKEKRNIPAPATQSDLYAAAILEELERIADALDALADRYAVQGESVPGVVELREPEPVKASNRDARKAQKG
jgi:hypothetical protein